MNLFLSFFFSKNRAKSKTKDKCSMRKVIYACIRHVLLLLCSILNKQEGDITQKKTILYENV